MSDRELIQASLVCMYVYLIVAKSAK